MRSRRRFVGCLLIAGCLLGAPDAQAGVLVATTADCERQVLERPFLPWADPAQYVLAPDGNLASGAGWRLAGAEVIAENEPYYVHGDDLPAALRLPPGSSATSAAMCVGLQHPTLRLFARNVGDPLGSLRVEVLFEDAWGDTHALAIGAVGGSDEWAPTLPMPVTANLLALLPGARTPVAFRFSPAGPRSSWLIDDVYVDPYGKG